MSDLVVLAFKNETDAFKMRDELVKLQKQEVITLQDAAVVVRHGDGKPKGKTGNQSCWCRGAGRRLLGYVNRSVVFRPLVRIGHWCRNWRYRRQVY